MEKDNDIKALFIIVNAGFAAEVIEIARDAGVKGATTLNARGKGKLHETFMGITIDTEKEIILCLIEGHIVDSVMAAIKEKSGRNHLANSVCFTMPVEKTTLINNFDMPESEPSV